MVVQWTSKKCTKSVMHVQSCCFANKGNVTRDDSQRRFLAKHSVATLLRHCFEWLQHCSSIATCVALKIVDANRPV